MKAIRLLPTNHDVEVIYINRSNQWLEQDKTIALPENIRLQYLNLGRKPFWPWFLATTLQKLSQLLYPFFTHQIDMNAFGSNKSSIMLRRLQNKMRKSDFHLISGHGSGALYPAWRLSNEWNIPFIFDLEDYHPGEYIGHDARNEKQRREYLMKTLLPKATVITSASPLIEEYTINLIGGHSKHEVILNSFPASEFVKPKSQHNSVDKLRLVWFSQAISFGRGLEQLFDAFRIMDSNLLKSFQLTVIGAMDERFYNQVIYPSLKSMNGFTFKHLPAMSQTALHAELTKFDMGLALEPGKDLNNNLALSNKIFAYIQSGLYVLATDTPAQRNFIENQTWAGEVCGLSVEEISQALIRSIMQVKNIRSRMEERFQRGKELAWEKESRVLSAIFQIE